MLCVMNGSSPLLANLSEGATNTAPIKDEYHTLTNAQGNSLQARILHVEGNTLFIRRTDNSIFKIELDQLSASSRSLAEDWDAHYGGDITPSQLTYLRNLGKPPVEKKPIAVKTKLPATDSNDRSKPFLLEPDRSVVWQPIDMLTDEFEGEHINGGKWHYDIKPWDDQSWSKDNTWVADGKLHLSANYEPHIGFGGVEQFYKLGIVISHGTTTYGYFEAKIKGCSLFPGVSPAAWLYNRPGEGSSAYPHVEFTSIDLARLQTAEYKTKLQATTDVSHIGLHLNCHYEELGQKMAMNHQTKPSICDNSWQAPWDPRDEFHIYAVETTPETITWYIDGKKVAQQENLYWHLPMNFSLSLGLRPPYIEWDEQFKRFPIPEQSTADGFPTEMQVEYIRAWTRQP